MMPEESETPGGEPPATREGSLTPLGRESDLFAERRARRVAETGEAALTRRAEAAEATVQTLERHVASLRQRLHEAHEEQTRLAELLEIERATALAGEDELRRTKQREYAEQQLRVEAEERLAEIDRSARAEGEVIARRLGAGERAARELAERLEEMQRQLAETEQTAAAEHSALTRAEVDLRARVEDLERRSLEMGRALEAERAARIRSEATLASMREGHGRMETLLTDIRSLVRRLATALAGRPGEHPEDAPGVESPAAGPPSQHEPVTVAAASPVQGESPAAAVEATSGEAGVEMAEALAAAVERLRARAEAAAAAAQAAAAGGQAAQQRAPHKHSASAIGRWRKRRKQRREARAGRADAA